MGNPAPSYPTGSAVSDYFDKNKFSPVIDGGHVQSENCWCNPRIMVPCPTCEAAPTVKGEPTCWRCAGEGFIEGEYRDDVACIIVHTGEVL